MAMNKEKASGIIVLVIICCVFMALIETIIEPAYIVKSALKVAVFLLLPLVYAKITHTKLLDEFFKIDKRGMMKLFVLGSFIYAVILGAYTLTKNFFDYASLVQSLSADQKVNSGSFIGVALYISFCNSFLEEFSFRCIYQIIQIHSPKNSIYIQFRHVCSLSYCNDWNVISAVDVAFGFNRIGDWRAAF
mgnify:CR=1 FL=1